MNPWLDRYADALEVPRLQAEEAEVLLDLARVVAHGTERKNAPLAAYLAGRTTGGATIALRTALELLGPETDAGA